MPVLRFRVYLEEDDQIYRDIEILPSQTFLDLHQAILKAYEFDGKHTASFFEANDKWEANGRELSSEVLVNKKDAPALSMLKTPVSALIQKTDQKFIYIYDPNKKWTFWVALITISKDISIKATYPQVVRKEGIAPPQYGIKGAGPRDKIMEIEEQYDLGSEEMEEGYGSEGSGPAEEQDNLMDY